MDKTEIKALRKSLLKAEIARQGQHVIARATAKPDRQINDLANDPDRSFGDGIAKEIGPKIRPDLPRDWLVYPDMKYLDPQVEPPAVADYPTASENPPIAFYPISQRDKDIAELVRLANLIDDTGLGMLLRDAQNLSEVRSLNKKQTPQSSK